MLRGMPGLAPAVRWWAKVTQSAIAEKVSVVALASRIAP
jgi:hypothetical protein